MSDAVEFSDCECVRESTDALLVTCEEWEDPLWFPKSQITEDSEVNAPGETGVLVVTSWIATEKELV